MRVSTFLADREVPFETLVHPPAFSATRRAKLLHVPGKQVVKSVLLVAPGGFLLAVLPATHQIDFDKLGQLLGGPTRLATLAEATRLFPDCEISAIPAFGSLYALNTLMDDAIERDSIIVFEGHTHLHAIRMTCKNYERLERPRRASFTIAPEPVLVPAPDAPTLVTAAPTAGL
jgi:Ala-tRNA(Pro) deacylase